MYAKWANFSDEQTWVLALPNFNSKHSKINRLKSVCTWKKTLNSNTFHRTRRSVVSEEHSFPPITILFYYFSTQHNVQFVKTLLARLNNWERSSEIGSKMLNTFHMPEVTNTTNSRTQRIVNIQNRFKPFPSISSD